MKKSQVKKMIQKPLRFHHQDIHEELDELKNEISEIKSILQELRAGVGRGTKDSGMRVSKYDYDFDR